MEDHDLKRAACFLAFFLASCLLGLGTARAEMILIAHEEVPATELGAETARAVFLGKKTLWSDGTPIVPVTLKKGPTHEAFLRKIVRRTQSQYATFWRRAIFTGTGTPPRSFGTEAEVVRFVRSSLGAVGYVDASTPHEGVKVLSIR